MAAPPRVRWVVKHGLARQALRRAARRGDPVARLSTDRSVAREPYPTYELVRSRGPLVRERLLRATADHAVAVEILRSDVFRAGVDPTTAPWLLRFMLKVARDPSALGPVDPPSMLVTDAPAHTRYRKLVTQVFTAKAIAGLTARIEDIADALLDELAGLEATDLLETYANLLPVTVISEILALPVEMRTKALAWGDAAAQLLDIGMDWPTFREADAAVREINDWLRDHFVQLRDHPGEDLLSQLVAAVDHGQRLTAEELMATALLVLGAGFETTVNLIANGVVLLLENPAELALLQDDPALWSNAVEEILRFDSPVQNTIRMVREPAEIAGQSLPARSVVTVLLAGANRDPKVFTDPGRFDVRRANAREHVAFSSGAHFCLGAHLARAEGEIALRTLFRRYPDLALAGAPVRRSTRTLRGWASVPVALRGRKSVSAD
jgi:cytochrome P450